MFNYISALYRSDPVYDPIPCAWDDENAALVRLMNQVHQEIGGRERAFRDGFQLGGRLMPTILENIES